MQIKEVIHGQILQLIKMQHSEYLVILFVYKLIFIFKLNEEVSKTTYQCLNMLFCLALQLSMRLNWIIRLNLKITQ